MLHGATMVDTTMLALNSVAKTYRLGVRAKRVEAVRDASFSIPEGGIVGFVGPNGAGKTTCIKIALGLIYPSRGTSRLMGLPSEHPSSRREIAYVSEQPYFYKHLTVLESLAFIARLRGIAESSCRDECGRALERVVLSAAANKKVGQLSKGMQQRLNMAQALLGDPRFFVFDEPMSGMDPPGRSLFRDIFRELQAAGRTIFFSTHILDDVEMLCSRVVVLSSGTLAYDGSVDDLLRTGFEGVDLMVTSVDDHTRNRAREMGAEVSALAEGGVRLFAPAGVDHKAVQQMLAQAGVYCDSVSVRRKPLERLLYGGTLIGGEDSAV